MEEMVPVVDENNNIVEIVPRSFMRKNKLPHRASYIVLSYSLTNFSNLLKSLLGFFIFAIFKSLRDKRVYKSLSL